MQAGRLRHIGTIEYATETKDGLGHPAKAWRTFGKSRIPCRVEELSGRELFNAQQTQPDVTMSVSLRWFDGVTSKMRLVWHDRDGDRVLGIESPPINPDGRKREMVLMCKDAK